MHPRFSYYGARHYCPQLGQFISPDTLVPDATNLFDYNRYMYARGNPMTYNDPTGHDPCDNGSKKCDPLWLEYTRGELECPSDPCGITFQQFLVAKQQYLAYKQTPENYDADIQIINGDMQGNVTGAQVRQSNALLYAEYFAHSNADVDIKQIAGTETMLAGMAILSGNAKDVVGSAPLNLAPDGAGRSGAFRQAKRDAGIPMSQQPDAVRLVADRTNPGQMVREYDFGDVTIQDHEWGHTYPDDPTQNRGPHFNLQPGGGHYDYQ